MSTAGPAASATRAGTQMVTGSTAVEGGGAGGRPEGGGGGGSLVVPTQTRLKLR